MGGLSCQTLSCLESGDSGMLVGGVEGGVRRKQGPGFL